MKLGFLRGGARALLAENGDALWKYFNSLTSFVSKYNYKYRYYFLIQLVNSYLFDIIYQKNRCFINETNFCTFKNTVVGGVSETFKYFK